MKCATISAVEDVLSVVSEKKKMMVTVLEPLMIVGAEKKKIDFYGGMWYHTRRLWGNCIHISCCLPCFQAW